MVLAHRVLGRHLRTLGILWDITGLEIFICSQDCNRQYRVCFIFGAVNNESSTTRSVFGITY